MNVRPIVVLRVAALLLLPFVAGCATTAADVARGIDPQASLPARDRIEQDLSDRAFALVLVDTDIREEHPAQFHLLPDEAYQRLLAYRLEQAFRKSGIDEGRQPACLVRVTIAERKFGHGGIIAEPSRLAAEVELSLVGGEMVMRAPLATGWLSSTTVFVGGVLVPVALPRSGAMAHSYEIPAMAILITKTLAGLRAGKTLDEIELSPDGRLVPHSVQVVEQNPWGIRAVTAQETERIGGVDLEELESPER